MSLVTANQAIVPSLWLNSMERTMSLGYDRQVHRGWQFVPESVKEFYDWVTIVDEEGNTAQGRTKVAHLVHRPSVMPNEDGECSSLTILLQGFMHQCAIGPLGNWKRKESDAPYATQFMVLELGGCHLAFDAQVGECMQVMEDDSLSALSSVHKAWKIVHMCICARDFIEILVAPKIEVVRSRKKRCTFVNFEMHEVVLLYTAKEVQSLSMLDVGDVRQEGEDVEMATGSGINVW
ncbi:hypothetical protein GY45DRAFT_1341584 [Cubamyces sp. BRFM 1775]|nr:hypothetical protein GY45DRAFT_1341584 [Cubamyces sp. BRFM 1775]